MRQQFPQTPRLIENDQHLTAFSSFLKQSYMLKKNNNNVVTGNVEVDREATSILIN